MEAAVRGVSSWGGRPGSRCWVKKREGADGTGTRGSGRLAKVGIKLNCWELELETNELRVIHEGWGKGQGFKAAFR